MRKLDILILKSFFAPFFLTTTVATFILVVQYMLKYFDDFVGKDLGFIVFGELIFFFSINMLQIALPLGVLVSSLMTYGNLGEHFELTAIKSAGISLTRTLQPVFFFVVILAYGAYNFNNIIVPAANLKAFSLLYDIKQTKPVLDIKQGMFYDGIPNYSIKVARKLPDNTTLLDVMIYDHSKRDGNKRVILADSAKMYTIFDDKYLKLELYRGNFFYETDKANSDIPEFNRTNFEQLDMVFNLSSFDMIRTKEELFQNNRQMKNIAQLTVDIDSMTMETHRVKENVFLGGSTYLLNTFQQLDKVRKEANPDDDIVDPETQVEAYQTSSMLPLHLFFQEPIRRPLKFLEVDTTDNQKIDSLILARTREVRKKLVEDSIKRAKKIYDYSLEEFDNEFQEDYKKTQIVRYAANQARNFKVNISGLVIRIDNIKMDRARYIIEKQKKYSQAVACIIMFLIGAPLGSIIKKGGLGVPVIISVFFFLSYYILTEIYQKWAKALLLDPVLATWLPNVILLPFGLFFLRQARIDARLFDSDVYAIWFDKVQEAWIKIRKRLASVG